MDWINVMFIRKLNFSDSQKQPCFSGKSIASSMQVTWSRLICMNLSMKAVNAHSWSAEWKPLFNFYSYRCYIEHLAGYSFEKGFIHFGFILLNACLVCKWCHKLYGIKLRALEQFMPMSQTHHHYLDDSSLMSSTSLMSTIGIRWSDRVNISLEFVGLMWRNEKAHHSLRKSPSGFAKMITQTCWTMSRLRYSRIARIDFILLRPARLWGWLALCWRMHVNARWIVIYPDISQEVRLECTLRRLGID